MIHYREDNSIYGSYAKGPDAKTANTPATAEQHPSVAKLQDLGYEVNTECGNQWQITLGSNVGPAKGARVLVPQNISVDAALRAIEMKKRQYFQ
jgi:hypothetical protein